MSTTHPKLVARLTVVINTHIGIHEHERQRRQRLAVNFEIGFVARRWPAVNIADVYDYDALYHYVTHTIPSEPHIDLIETLIEKLLDFVFADDRVQDLRIDCSKPNVLEHATGVGVSAHWERAEWLAVSASTSIVR